MGTHTALSHKGVEISEAYRELEVAYHELQVAQVHLRTVHARSMHDRMRDRTLFRQELSRLSDRMTRTMKAYRAAMDAYVRATDALLDEEPGAWSPPRTRSTVPRFRADTAS